MVRHYNTLIGGTTKTTLKDVLDDVMRHQKLLLDSTKENRKKLDELEEEVTFHIQRIGLVRFNPFADTGGSQSFTLALLDGEGNGLVMTSLYGRSGNRWYVKHVKAGKGIELELSKEERTAIEKAKKVGKS